MITEVHTKNQRKKRDASYYREYRQKKKRSADVSKVIPFPTKMRAPIPSFSISQFFSKLGLTLTFLFALVLTGMLIHLSAPFYAHGNSSGMAYLMAGVVELSLIFLITLPAQKMIDRVAKGALILCLSLYALVPIFLNPIHEVQSNLDLKKTQTSIFEKLTGSLQSEIESRKLKSQILMERGRALQSQRELQVVAQLENELRNTISRLQPVAEGSENLQTAYGVAIQRVLLMLCNLFLVHHLVASLRGLVAIRCKTFKESVVQLRHATKYH